MERGYAGLAVEAVAARAGVGKATVYRWWPGRAELAVDAFFAATEAELAFPGSGSGREDFRRQILGLGALLRSPAGGVLTALLGGARTEPELARALAERWILPRKAWGEARMEDARAAGELLDGVETDAALGALYGPLYARLLFGRPPLGEEEIEAYLAIVLRGVFRTDAGAGTRA